MERLRCMWLMYGNIPESSLPKKNMRCIEIFCALKASIWSFSGRVGHTDQRVLNFGNLAGGVPPVFLYAILMLASAQRGKSINVNITLEYPNLSLEPFLMEHFIARTSRNTSLLPIIPNARYVQYSQCASAVVWMTWWIAETWLIVRLTVSESLT